MGFRAKLAGASGDGFGGVAIGVVVRRCSSEDAWEVACNEGLKGWDAGANNSYVGFDCRPDKNASGIIYKSFVSQWW
jgi:hypothetical protein